MAPFRPTERPLTSSAGGTAAERRIVVAGLVVRLHLAAFRAGPLAYAHGLWWRLRGLRLRSRNRLLALAGNSPAAYALWIARKEPRVSAAAVSHPHSIVPVIDCRADCGDLDQSLQSLAAEAGGVTPLLIGGGSFPGTMTVVSPRDLAAHVPATGAWICPMRPGDRLAAGALQRYAAAAAKADGDIIYADDDLIDGDGTRSAPHFKPDWNPELFEHHDYLTGACVVRASREMVSNLPADSWVGALISAAVGRGPTPVHLPDVLHHRRRRPHPRVPDKPAGLSDMATPSVCVIIPTRNRHELLRACVEGLQQTSYSDWSATIVDNGSDDARTLAYLAELERDGFTVMRRPGAFNYSSLNNEAAREASGEYLCFLNNDVEMIDPDWLSLMVRQAVRPEVGAVGARLLYPDRTIQHAGVCIGIGDAAGHAHRLQAADQPGYFERARLPQRISAVTAACMVVSREKFQSVGGFEERHFPVAFNDVDLCLKLAERGWHSLYEPRATLIHHESKSRGSDRARANRVRFASELAALRAKWHTDVMVDPFHHPQLDRFSEQFVVGF